MNTQLTDTLTIPSKKHTRRAGLTLVELLASIAIVGVLSSIVVAVSSNVLDSAAATEESSSARQAITAFLMTPMDNQGKYMAGYLNGEAASDLGLTDPSGRPITGVAAQRYTWRLAPYMDKNVESLYVGNQQGYFETNPSEYFLSLYPSFGINAVFAGGRYQIGADYSPPIQYIHPRTGESMTSSSNYAHDFWVLRPHNAINPSKLVVFASSHFIEGSDHYHGFHQVTAPKNPAGSDWSSSVHDDIPASSGNVHFRHSGRAVVANLDGSVELLDETQLRDMRRWSNQAAKYNEAEFSSWTRSN